MRHPEDPVTLSEPALQPELGLLAEVLGPPRGLEAARALLREFGGLAALACAPAGALARVPGVGPLGARRVAAACALARRTRGPGPAWVRSAEDAAAVLGPLLAELDHERLVGVYLSRPGRVLGVRVLGVGSLDALAIEVPGVLRPAVQLGATGVVLGHNHPSGDPTPSAADVRATLELARAAQVLRLRVLDHLVLADGGWRSLAVEGLLPLWSIDPAPRHR